MVYMLIRSKEYFANYLKNDQSLLPFEEWKKNTNLYKIWNQRVDVNDIRYKLCNGDVEVFVKRIYDFLEHNLDNFLYKVYESGFSDKQFREIESVKTCDNVVSNTSNNSGYFRNVCMEEIVECGGDNDINLSIKKAIQNTMTGKVRKCFFMPSIYEDIHNNIISSSMILSFNKSCKLASIISPNIYNYLLRVMKRHSTDNCEDILFSTASWCVPVIAVENLNYKNVSIVDVQDGVLKKCHLVSNSRFKKTLFETNNFTLNTYCVPSERMDQIITQKYDNIISCPPYYDLEIYGGSEEQSTNLYKTYEEWLENYWRKTVIASKKLLRKNGIFAFIMGHNIRYHFMANDMIKIAKQENLTLIDQIKIIPKKQIDNIHTSSFEKYEVCSYFRYT